jgi:hypothetical protein
MNILVVVCLFSLVAPAWALNRQAFTFPRYDLEARIEPWQQRLGVRGKIRLRNDSAAAQKDLVLQISSTLNWSAIALGGKSVQFLSQLYNSDIDHTGSLREAVVTLPESIPPQNSIELEVGYEGVIAQDSTRLVRMGVPLEQAKHSDWDRISNSFSIVRGIGYVAWYPIATEAVGLGEGNTVFREVGRWKRRQSESEMDIRFCLLKQSAMPMALMNDGASAPGESSTIAASAGETFGCSSHLFSPLGFSVPTFAVGDYREKKRPEMDLYYLPGNESSANDYALAIQETAPVVKSWFEASQETTQSKPLEAELPETGASPFAAGNLLLLPLSASDAVLILSAVEQLTQSMVASPRAWIFEGLPRYAQVNYLELRRGREAAMRYLENHRSALVETEKQAAAEHSLLDANDELYIQAKAMYVWWMLKDMLGENTLHAALRKYRADDDRQPHYLQQLIASESHRDLGWFFDDWVYHDRGLPDFHIVSVYSHPQANAAYMVTVMIENRGGAAAEVPVTVHFSGGERTERLMVRNGAKASVRILAAAAPREVTVNDGSVPELGVSNHSYQFSSSSEQK